MIVFMQDAITLCIGLCESDVQRAIEHDELIVSDNDTIRKVIGPFIGKILRAWNGIIVVSINNTREQELAMVLSGYLVINLDDESLQWAREADGILKGGDKFRTSLKVFASELLLFEFAMTMQAAGAKLHHDDKTIHPN